MSTDQHFNTNFKNTGKPRFMNTWLIQTPHYYRQFALSRGKESPYILSKLNPRNKDTLLIRTDISEFAP